MNGDNKTIFFGTNLPMNESRFVSKTIKSHSKIPLRYFDNKLLVKKNIIKTTDKPFDDLKTSKMLWFLV